MLVGMAILSETCLVTCFNPLPTNDAHMCHGLSISHKNLYGGFNSLGPIVDISVMVTP